MTTAPGGPVEDHLAYMLGRLDVKVEQLQAVIERLESQVERLAAMDPGGGDGGAG